MSRQLVDQAGAAHVEVCESAKAFLAGGPAIDGIRDALYTCRTEAMSARNEARASVTTAAIDAIEAMVRPDLIGDLNARARHRCRREARARPMTPQPSARDAPNRRSSGAKTRLPSEFKEEIFDNVSHFNEKANGGEVAGSDDVMTSSRR